MLPNSRVCKLLFQQYSNGKITAQEMYKKLNELESKQISLPIRIIKYFKKKRK